MQFYRISQKSTKHFSHCTLFLVRVICALTGVFCVPNDILLDPRGPRDFSGRHRKPSLTLKAAMFAQVSANCTSSLFSSCLFHFLPLQSLPSISGGLFAKTSMVGRGVLFERFLVVFPGSLSLHLCQYQRWFIGEKKGWTSPAQVDISKDHVGNLVWGKTDRWASWRTNLVMESWLYLRRRSLLPNDLDFLHRLRAVNVDLKQIRGRCSLTNRDKYASANAWRRKGPLASFHTLPTKTVAVDGFEASIVILFDRDWT